MTNSKKRMAFDMLLNIVASAVPLCVLQLVVLPLIAADMSGDSYGLVVTMLSLFSMGPGVLGTVLNNIRLVYEEKYRSIGVVGDFNYLLVVCSAIGIMFVCLSYLALDSFDAVVVLLAAATSITWICNSYFIVAFRLIINYKAILISSLFQSAGYAFGFALYAISDQWMLIYLFGQLCSLAYILSHGKLQYEPVCKTELFSSVTKESVSLAISHFLSSAMTYADRLLLFPLIGGSGVGVYYISTLVGKILSMAVNPINSVVLTYLAKSANKPVKTFYTALGLGTLVCVFAYIVILLSSRPILSLLYPVYVDEAMKYVWVTSATALVFVLISIAQPFTLKFYSMKWQIAINGLTCIVYIGMGMGLFFAYGLMGFCVGVLIANIVRLATMLAINAFIKPDSMSIELEE